MHFYNFLFNYSNEFNLINIMDVLSFFWEKPNPFMALQKSNSSENTN